MRNLLLRSFWLIICISFFVAYGLQAQHAQYFNFTPDFKFAQPDDYSTGLGVADMNNDGWPDIVISNGNDIERKHVEVYLNDGSGNFSTTPDWASNDIDYHGHLAIGDFDKNGWNDIVVSVYLGASGFSQPGKLKVYYNYETGIDSLPSFISEPFYSFSCAVGDVDNDGDLDIAATAGESYHNIAEHARIFINENGMFSDTSVWMVADSGSSYDVKFADFNRDGLSDVVFGHNGFQSRIYLNSNSGSLNDTASWENSDSSLLVNSLDVGFIDGNQYPDGVFTNNNQEGGDGMLKSYLFNDTSFPGTSLPGYQTGVWDYQSGVKLHDIDNDGVSDLFFGGWWEPVRLIYGNDNGLNDSVYFSTNETSVVEAIVFADLDREDELVQYDTIVPQIDSMHFIYLKQKHISNILSVSKNGNQLSTDQYCFVPHDNWFSLARKAGTDDTLVVEYSYSPFCDMVVTNWGGRSFIYYNQKGSNQIASSYQNEAIINCYPNPAHGSFNIEVKASLLPLEIDMYNTAGRKVKQITVNAPVMNVSVHDLQKGTYFMRCHQIEKCNAEIIIVQ